MSKRKTEFELSAFDNSASYEMYYCRLVDLAISRFEWLGLPETVNKTYLERMLFYKGQVVFFQDEVMGYLTLPVIANGPYDVYGIPIQREAVAQNSYRKNLNKNDSVIIYNNMMRNPYPPIIGYFARQLWDLDRTAIVNARAQKTPVAVSCDENQRLSVLNAYKEIDGNAPAIFTNKAFNKESISVFQTQAPFVADRIYQLKMSIWNEALSFLGISINNSYKKERQNQQETSQFNSASIASRDSRLEARRQACEQINAMFGLNVECYYKNDMSQAESVLPEFMEEVTADE